MRFSPSDLKWPLEKWASWPFLSCAADQGSDGVCGYHALAYMKKCNVGAFWDWSHGVCRDLEAAYKLSGVWHFVLLLMLTHNIGHGPDRDECLRFHQLQEVMSFMLGSFDAETSELFQAYSSQMLEELGDKVPVFDGHTPEQSLWQYLRTSVAFPKLGHGTMLCQFMGCLRETQALLPRWSEMLFKAEAACLELDFSRGGASRQPLCAWLGQFSDSATLLCRSPPLGTAAPTSIRISGPNSSPLSGPCV